MNELEKKFIQATNRIHFLEKEIMDMKRALETVIGHSKCFCEECNQCYKYSKKNQDSK